MPRRATRPPPKRWNLRANSGLRGSRIEWITTVTVANRTGVVPRLRIREHRRVPFTHRGAFPSRDVLATRTGGLHWTQDRPTSRMTAHDGLHNAHRPSPSHGRSAGQADFRALLRRRVRNVPRTVSSPGTPYPSMGLFPLQGPPPTVASGSTGTGDGHEDHHLGW